jgi:hypothetical protein
MRRKVRERWAWYPLMVLMIFGLLGWMQPAGANNSDDGTGTGAIVQAYDAGFTCGTVSGNFNWSPSLRNILVSGFVFDGCGEGATSATFTAYADSSVMTHTESVDDGQRDFVKLLSSQVPVERIVIKVCRVPGNDCGPATEFWHP